MMARGEILDRGLYNIDSYVPEVVHENPLAIGGNPERPRGWADSFRYISDQYFLSTHIHLPLHLNPLLDMNPFFQDILESIPSGLQVPSNFEWGSTDSYSNFGAGPSLSYQASLPPPPPTAPPFLTGESPSYEQNHGFTYQVSHFIAKTQQINDVRMDGAAGSDVRPTGIGNDGSRDVRAQF